MRAVAVKAHFDGERIVLDEPVELLPNAPLLVMLLPETGVDSDSEESWLTAACSSDAFDFLADPAEDIYTLDDGEPVSDAL